MITTEEQWNSDEARDIVMLLCDTATGAPEQIGLVGSAGVRELDRNLALAIAARLVTLAAQLPEPPRILHRSHEVNDRLATLD